MNDELQETKHTKWAPLSSDMVENAYEYEYLHSVAYFLPCAFPQNLITTTSSEKQTTHTHMHGRTRKQANIYKTKQ